MNLQTKTVAFLSKNEAEKATIRVRNSAFLRTYGIELYTEPSSEPFCMGDGTKSEAVFLKVRAETECQCGMGVGFMIALIEGVQK